MNVDEQFAELLPAGGSFAAVSEDEEEGDVCRICRMPAEEDNPLFFPCKCSGSIKYVHQQCLVDWLNHSGNTHCEVCKHKFSFTPVYAKDAPTKLPLHELIIGLLRRAATAVRMAHRVWVVCTVWLVLVPLVTNIAWKAAFSQSLSEVYGHMKPQLSIVAIMMDCAQGSFLSVAIVFLNMGFNTLRDCFKSALQSFEQQLLRAAASYAAAEANGNAPPQADAGGGGAIVGQADEGIHDMDDLPGAMHFDPVAADMAAARGGGDDVLGRPAADLDLGGGGGGLPPALIMGGLGEPLDHEAPFEELIGLQGSWWSFLETVVLVMMGNAFFMFMFVWLPVNIGRYQITAWQQSVRLLQTPAAALITSHLALNSTATNASDFITPAPTTPLDPNTLSSIYLPSTTPVPHTIAVFAW